MAYQLNNSVFISDTGNISANSITCITPISASSLGTGTANASTYLCGNGTWTTINLSKTIPFTLANGSASNITTSAGTINFTDTSGTNLTIALS